eukprot:361949-Chlamydomonas_euryale.AAC.1
MVCLQAHSLTWSGCAVWQQGCKIQLKCHLLIIRAPVRALSVVQPGLWTPSHLASEAAAAKVVAVGARGGLVLGLELWALRRTVAQAAADDAALDARRLGELLHLLERVVEREQEVRHTLLGLSEQVLEVEQDGLVGKARVDERCRHARLAAAARAADAVHVVLDLVRHVVVDDVLDVGEVEALGRDVGRNEHVGRAALERVDRGLALRLVLVAVHRHRFHALRRKRSAARCGACQEGLSAVAQSTAWCGACRESSSAVAQSTALCGACCEGVSEMNSRMNSRNAPVCVCVKLQLWTAQPPLAEWIRRGQPAHTPPPGGV